MKNILLFFILLTLISCTDTPVVQPTPFAIGDKIQAPMGCVALRKENPNADC